MCYWLAVGIPRFWCGERLVVVCRPVPVWARSVFGARSLVWSVVWVLRADGLTVVDCRSVRDSLESSGFVVLPWQTDQCRPVLVWTGSDSVLWSPIWSRYATRPVVSSPCHHVIVSSHHHPDSASRRITDQSARQPVSPPASQPPTSQALASLIPLSAPRPPIHPINPPIDPLTSLTHPPSILKIT